MNAGQEAPYRINFGAFALIFFAIPIAASSMTIQGYLPERHERFYQPVAPSDPAKEFIGDSPQAALPFDLSGVGRVLLPGGSVQRWATMISDTYYLTARHWAPGESATVRFYRDDDLTGDYYDAIVEDDLVATIGKSADGYPDLAIGRLSEAPPDWVQRYPLVKRPEGLNYLSLVDPTATVVGLSQPELLTSAYSMRVGRNEIELARYFSEEVGYVVDPLTIKLSYDTDGSGLGDDETNSVPGDSGSPVFVSTQAGLVLAGINFAKIGTCIGTGCYEDLTLTSAHSVSANLAEIIGNVPESIEIVTDLIGDLNGDYRVNSLDWIRFSSNWLEGPGASYNDGDVNGDGYVNSQDQVMISGNWGNTIKSSADFDFDNDVDASDLKQIGSNWLQSVTAGSVGDANGDGIVDDGDIDSLNESWRFVGLYFQPPPPLVAVPGDINGDGLVDSIDSTILGMHWHQTVEPGQDGDINGDGFVDSVDLAIQSTNWDPYGPADIDEDLSVNNEDLSILLSHWEMTNAAGKEEGDLNLDGIVDSLDFDIMADWWGRRVSSVAEQPPISLIPEPASASNLAAAVVVIAFWFRRSCDESMR